MAGERKFIAQAKLNIPRGLKLNQGSWRTDVKPICIFADGNISVSYKIRGLPGRKSLEPYQWLGKCIPLQLTLIRNTEIP